MSGFLFDTLAWTGALILGVLVLRRPVTRWFGPKTAYALWALPMLRLLLPPIHLPAWLAPAKAAADPLKAGLAKPATADGAGLAAGALDSAAHGAQISHGIAADAGGGPAAGSTLLGALAALPWIEIAVFAWGAGALAFLYFRFSAYFRLRGELVEGACEVGTAQGPLGTIRLIETPGTTAPIAFGVMRPVIALPPGFMAQPDRTSRDLALDHELAHHRGHDLLINVLAQPLFAMHWFNPLARYGWLALRRDQEAACDARVIAAKPRAERALYAKVIASFAAAGPNVALAAPMACPVLGDKSIIQRLRNLKMTEQSSKSRRRAIAGRVLLGSAIVALPLTASISYAESVAPAAPAVPAGPVLAPAPQVVPPLAPVAPQAALQAALQAAPEAPQPPVPPTPPAAPSTERRVETVIVTVDPDTGDAQTTSTVTDGQSSVKMKDKSFTVITEFDERETGKQKKKVKSRYQTIKLVNDGSPMSKEEREALLAELRESLAEADAEIDGLPERLAETMAEFEAMTGEGRSRTVVRMGCTSGSDEVSTTTERADGSTEVLICQSRIMAEALQGLKQARSAIAKNREMQGSMRSQILKELDQQIRTWEKETR